jgi:hypothetical protein
LIFPEDLFEDPKTDLSLFIPTPTPGKDSTKRGASEVSDHHSEKEDEED